MTIIAFRPRRARVSALGDRQSGVPATGSFMSPRAGPGVFAGSFRIVSLVSQGGRLALDGVFSGTLADGNGAHIGVGSRRSTSPVRVSAVGDGLELVLGPVEIDLLGFRVATDALRVELLVDVGRQARRNTLRVVDDHSQLSRRRGPGTDSASAPSEGRGNRALTTPPEHLEPEMSEVHEVLAALDARMQLDAASQLTDVLAGARQIGVAIGLVMAQEGLDRDEAFGLLVRASRRSGCDLSHVAAAVEEVGGLTSIAGRKRLTEPRSSPSVRTDAVATSCSDRVVSSSERVRCSCRCGGST